MARTFPNSVVPAGISQWQYSMRQRMIRYSTVAQRSKIYAVDSAKQGAPAREIASAKDAAPAIEFDYMYGMREGYVVWTGATDCESELKLLRKRYPDFIIEMTLGENTVPYNKVAAIVGDTSTDIRRRIHVIF